jgi:hypothetical protein
MEKKYSVTVQFDLSKVELNDIFDIERRLAKLGIHFDTGAGGGYRDWELDWSIIGPMSVKVREEK